MSPSRSPAARGDSSDLRELLPSPGSPPPRERQMHRTPLEPEDSRSPAAVFLRTQSAPRPRPPPPQPTATCAPRACPAASPDAATPVKIAHSERVALRSRHSGVRRAGEPRTRTPGRLPAHAPPRRENHRLHPPMRRAFPRVSVAPLHIGGRSSSLLLGVPRIRSISLGATPHPAATHRGNPIPSPRTVPVLHAIHDVRSPGAVRRPSGLFLRDGERIHA